MLKLQHDEFNRFLAKLKKNQHFALARFADGERLFMEGRSAVGIDGWASPTGRSALGDSLIQAIQIALEQNCYLGISDDSNDPESKLFYSNLLSRAPSDLITLSNIFVNGTYQNFCCQMLPELTKRKLVVICNHKAKALECSIELDSEPLYIYIPKNCGEFWERASSKWIQSLSNLAAKLENHIFLFAAGPISSSTIPLLWSTSKTNTYIDIGSALDPLFYGRYTRPYQQKGSDDSRQMSTIFIQDDIQNEPDTGITCIINCYKRWDGLSDIVNALERQSLPPKEIHILFNTLPPPELVNELRNKASTTNIVCSDKNLGVWNRFAYALNIKTEYICIFDDDTVPGEKWLENCNNSMIEREGLYGTVGLRLYDKDCYMNHRRFGWPSPNVETEEVDLVGHSWFFKREWLPFYWRDLPPAHGYDFMGEDMHMSFAIQKYLKLPTLVPPHPSDNHSLWGSIASSRGVDSHAISMTGKASRMDYAVKRLVDLGWRLPYVSK